MSEIHVYLLLFGVAWLSATVLPSQAEILLFALLAGERWNAQTLVLAAAAGSTAGSVANYYAGKYITRFENKKWFPVKREYLLKAKNLLEKHGTAALCLTWAPFIGDPLTVAAGMARIPMKWFLPLVAVGKTLRYAAVWALYAGLF